MDATCNCFGFLYRHKKVKVKKIEDIQKGTHVAIDKSPKPYFHHAIVKQKAGQDVTLIEFTKGNGKIDIHENTHRFEQIEKELGELYKVEHQPKYKPDDIISRAESKEGKNGTYNPFTNNCEHFANWCVEGESISDQSEDLKIIAAFGGMEEAVRGIIQIVMKGKTAAAKSIPFKEMAKNNGWNLIWKNIRETISSEITSNDGIKSKVKSILSAIEKFWNKNWEELIHEDTALKCEKVIVILMILLELLKIAVGIYKVYQKKKAGELTGEEFAVTVTTQITSGLGGMIASVAGGVLGQMWIPIPYIGGLLGAFIGSFVGRMIGAKLGALLVPKMTHSHG